MEILINQHTGLVNWAQWRCAGMMWSPGIIMKYLLRILSLLRFWDAEKNFLKQPSIISHWSSESWPCVPEKGLAKSSLVRAKLRKLHLNPTFQLDLILTWLGIAQRLKDKFQLAAGCLTYHLSLECLKILSTEATVKFDLQVWLAKAEQNSLWFKLLADFLMPWNILIV